MSRRRILNKFQVLEGMDSSMSPVSEPTDVSGLDNITYLVEIDPSVDGEMLVEHCEDEKLSDSSVFKELNFGEQVILNSANDLDYTLQIKNAGFRHMRLSFVDNGGSGNINAWISGNTVGA